MAEAVCPHGKPRLYKDDIYTGVECEKCRIHKYEEKYMQDCQEEKPADVDLVNHPPHYKANGMEAIDVIEAFAPSNYHRGNALKYLLRAGKKGDLIQDLRKAIWYIEREIGK